MNVGEIERAIRGHDAVAKVIVMTFESGGTTLVAFYSCRTGKSPPAHSSWLKIELARILFPIEQWTLLQLR